MTGHPDRPLRVTHYLEDLDLEKGGVVRAVLDMASVGAAHGIDMRVVSANAAAAPGEWAEGGPVCVGIDRPTGPLGSLTESAARTLREEIERADVVHLHTPWEPSNVPVSKLCRSLGTPYVVSPHGMFDGWSMKQRGLKKRAYLALRGSAMVAGAAFVHYTAQAERDQSERYASGAAGRVVPLIFDLEPFVELPPESLATEAFPDVAEAKSSGRPVVLFLSRVHYKKGVRAFIEAASALTSKGVDASWIVVGPGDPPAYLEEMRALADASGVGDRVKFLGPVMGQTKVSLYRAADLFVLPTSQENFGFVFLEALASETAVLTTKGVDTWPELERSGGSEIIGLGPDGAARGEDVARGVERMLADRERLASRALAARTWVLEEFSPPRLAASFESMYRDAVGGASE